jgi:uncharacterized protein
MSPSTKWWLGVLATLALVIAAQAEPVNQLKPTGYVNDFAHVLDPTSIAQMESICRQIDEKAHAQIAVVTIHTLDGADAGSYAVDLFQKWGVGSKSTDRGVLILYAIDDRRDWIEVAYGLEPILPDGKVGGFRREAVPLMRNGQYSQALLLVTSRIAQVIAEDAKIELSGSDIPARRTRQTQSPGMSPVGIVLLIVVVIIVLMTPLRGILFWMLLSGGGRGGGWGGGGFGGGGGGGGFGGFGGGSTGGGGAGGSW